jgi:hypothetical protein
MKRVWPSAALGAGIAIAAVLAFSGCNVLGIGAKAEVVVTGHRTAPMDIGEIVYYTATNTGSLKLLSLDMDFRVRYEDGSSYHGTWSEADLEPGASVSGECWVTTDKAGAPIEEVTVYKIDWSTW